MDLVGHAIEFLALLQLFNDVGVTGSSEQSREPVEPGDDAVLDFARRHMPGPAYHRRHAEAPLQDRALALREWCLSTVGPGEDFSAVVGGEHDDGVVVAADVLELLHHKSDVVVEL